MDDWQKDFYKLLNNISQDVEQLFKNVSEAIDIFTEDINGTVDYISETVVSITEEFHNSITADFNEYFQELFDPLLDIYSEFEDINLENNPQEADLLINPKVEPTTEHNPACIGCQHYHGRVYNGSILVCGMHPYGWDDSTCPDWESKSRGR